MRPAAVRPKRWHGLQPWLRTDMQVVLSSDVCLSGAPAPQQDACRQNCTCCAIVLHKPQLSVEMFRHSWPMSLVVSSLGCRFFASSNSVANWIRSAMVARDILQRWSVFSPTGFSDSSNVRNEPGLERRVRTAAVWKQMSTRVNKHCRHALEQLTFGIDKPRPASRPSCCGTHCAKPTRVLALPSFAALGAVGCDTRRRQW